MPNEMRSDSEAHPQQRFSSHRLTAVAQVAEVVAAVAVVISLVYVGRELESNTAAIRGSSVQEATIASSESLLNVASDSSLARILQVGREDPSRLTEVEALRYHSFRRQFLLITQSVYLQNELGTIEPRAWRVYERIVCDLWDTPGTRETWPLHRHLLDEGFVALVESCP